MTPQSKTAQIAMRDATVISDAGVVATANTILNAINDVGMVRVSETDYVGQHAGLVLTDPPPQKWKKYVKQSAAGSVTHIFQVFKHPTLNLFVKVAIGTRAIGSSLSPMHMWVSYTIFSSIANGAENGESIVVSPHLHGNSQVSENQYPFTTLNLKVYCDDNTFWIATEPSIFCSSIASNILSFMPFSPLAMLIQKSDLNSILILTSPYHTSTYIGGSESNTNPDMYPFSPRRWTLKGGTFLKFAAFGSSFSILPEHMAASNKYGIRVHRSSFTDAQGEKHTMNFGTVNASAAPANTAVEVDLTGGGPTTYMVSDGFGTTFPIGNIAMTPASVPNWLVATQVSLLLPWVVM